MGQTGLLGLGIGAVLSAGLLTTFACAHTANFGFLNLEAQWIAVAGVPLLVALLAGGYIRSFKGFGVEVEGVLREKVDNADLSEAEAVSLRAGEVAAEASAVAKGSLAHLHRLPDASREDVKCLIFVVKSHYDPVAIDEYLQRLPNVQFPDTPSQRRWCPEAPGNLGVDVR